MNGGTDLSALGTVGLSHRLSHPSRRGGTRGPYRPLSRPTAAEPPVPAAAELRICPTAQSMAVGRGGAGLGSLTRPRVSIQHPSPACARKDYL